MYRIRLVLDCNIKYKPNIGHEYHLVLIKGDCLAGFFGNKSTSEFHIYENETLYGNLKCSPELKEYHRNEIKKIKVGKIVKVGRFVVKKIVFWGPNSKFFSIHGEPVIYDNFIYHDNETRVWQYNLNDIYNKYNLQEYIKEEQLYIDKKNIEEENIIINGWDVSKPITKDNYPPDIEYPPKKWNGVNLELSNKNLSGYKGIYVCNSKYNTCKTYYYKINKYKNSKYFDSPVLAAYQYSLMKIKEKEENDKKESMLIKYPNKKYLYCPFEEKDECKSLGGCWDQDKKSWYIPIGVDNKNFEKWFYPYKNENNNIEKFIITWFCWKFHFYDSDKWFDGGIGKWVIIIDNNKLDSNDLRYLDKQIGITGFKIWQEKRKEKIDYFDKTTRSICIYCGWKNIDFNDQINWINYIGYKLSKDKLLKKISIRKQLYFKLNEDTINDKYNYNTKNVSKITLSFI